MITLKQFKEMRTKDGVSENLFLKLFTQWVELNRDGKLTTAEDVGYLNEARIHRDFLGLEIANKIMENVTNKNTEN